MSERLQKFMAECGIASRRKCEIYIEEGKVSVNGVVVTEPGTKVSEVDTVLFCGEPVKKQEELCCFMLYKPEGYVSTSADQFGRPIVIDLISEKNLRVFPVGRLDYDTSGLLLLTNDGDLAFKLTHPKHETEKTYEAVVSGIPTEQEMQSFRKGLVLDGYKTAPARIALRRAEGKNALLEITIREGKNRQVRKMCAAIGHNVLSLKRISIGGLKLGDLQKGCYRRLSDSEIDYLKNI